MNLTPSALEYIKTKVPDKGLAIAVIHFLMQFLCISDSSAAGRLDTAEWKEFISQPSLPHILKMLRGLCQHHSKTQVIAVTTLGYKVCQWLFLSTIADGVQCGRAASPPGAGIIS